MSAAATSVRVGALMWVAQRASAAVLALCVLVHLVTIIHATREGLTAAEILGRTQGSTGWFAFYVLFVAAVAIHAPIGLRAIVSEWTSWRGRSLDWATLLAGLALFVWGLRAMWGVFR